MLSAQRHERAQPWPRQGRAAEAASRSPGQSCDSLSFGAFGSFGQDSDGLDGGGTTERRIRCSPRKSGPSDTWVDAEMGLRDSISAR